MLVRDIDTSRPYQINALCDRFEELPDGVLDYYVENLSHEELLAYEYVIKNKHQMLFDDQDIWPDIHSPDSRLDFKYLSEHVGIFRRLVSRLNDNSRWFDCITFQFDNKYHKIPEHSYTRAQELIPHLAQAIEHGRINHRLNVMYRAVLGALDHVRIGMCVVLDNGEVIVANKEAKRLLDMNDGLSLSATGHLYCDSTELSAEIGHAATMLSNTAKGINSQAIYSLKIPRKSVDSEFLLEITALRDCRSEIETGLSGALLTVIDTEKKYQLDLSVFGRAYKLTDAELKVTELIIAGLENQEIADDRGVKVSTIKAQVKSIRVKTGVTSRVQLLRLVLQTDPPIGDE